MDEPVKMVTGVAPVNIAVVKYWGKRNEQLILPLNDSLSGTLSTDDMCAKTTVACHPSFKQDMIWLNGKQESFSNPRLKNVLDEIKRRAGLTGKWSDEQLRWGVRICSVNNFPTAAGLASSAAGYAALVYTLAQLYGVSGDITAVARVGSGSACRSLYGGWVQWKSGVLDDGSDSIAEQIAPANTWPEMRVLILVVSDSKKKTSSTSGMQASVQTSALLQHRVQNLVSVQLKRISEAIAKNDYETFARITMSESNQFHAVCLDTYPPCVYMNDISHAIVNLIHTINSDAGRAIAAYTFDAGPNACIYLLEENIPLVLSAINYVFPFSTCFSEYYRGFKPTTRDDVHLVLPSVKKHEPWERNTLRYVIGTTIGDGPKLLSSSEHLLNESGNPM